MNPKTYNLKQIHNKRNDRITFNRLELNSILKIYGRMVTLGEWRDYGISSLTDRAIFSIFRRTTENPIYMIVKSPRNLNKQGIFSVVSIDGQILIRARDIHSLLKIFNKIMIRSVS